MSSLEAKIHQGRYDSVDELLPLRVNALERNRIDILDAVNQRLKKIYPKIYQRQVGQLQQRKRDKRFKCYCNDPKSLFEVFKEIRAESIHPHCLTCDACWQEDLCTTWGYYGWSTGQITQDTWDALCEKRAYHKFV